MRTLLITDPKNKTLKKWVECLNLDFGRGTTIPRVTDPDKWWDWANQFIAMNNFGGRAPTATKGIYPSVDNWKDWAYDVIDSFNSETR